MSSYIDSLLLKARPHIFEKICLSLDYESFKKCLEVNKAWKTVLTAPTFLKKAAGWLQDAARMSDRNGVQLLLDRGADPNKADENGRTPLHGPAQYGETDTVKILLDRGSDPNIRDDNGDTPINLALERGHMDAANIMMSA